MGGLLRHLTAGWNKPSSKMVTAKVDTFVIQKDKHTRSDDPLPGGGAGQ